MSTSSRSSGPVGSIERLADPDVMDHNLHILKWLEGIKRKTMARKTLIIRKNPPSITVKTHLASPTGTVPEEGSALMTPPPTSTSHPSHELRKDVTTLRTASSAAASPSAATADDAGAPVNRSERKRKQSMSHDKNGKQSPSSSLNNQNTKTGKLILLPTRLQMTRIASLSAADVASTFESVPSRGFRASTPALPQTPLCSLASGLFAESCVSISARIPLR